MDKIFRYGFAPTVGALLLTLFACEGLSSQAEQTDPKYVMPSSTFTVTDTARFLNYWTEGDYFYVIGLADNHTGEWARIWVQLEILDASGHPLKYDGETTVVNRTFSDGIPPSGQSAFFAQCALKKFNGTPASARVVGMRGISVSPEAILVCLDVSALRMLRPDSVAGDTARRQVEFSRLAVGNIANPLNMIAEDYCVELALYGESDSKLWFVQPVYPNRDSIIWQERKGPLQPNETRKISMQVYYENLPKPLQTAKIGLVEMYPSVLRDK